MEEPAPNYVQSVPLTDSRLDDTHIRSWRDKGFALVHDLLPQSLLTALKQDALAFYPARQLPRQSERYATISAVVNAFVFPVAVRRRLTRSLCTRRCSKPLPTCSVSRC